MQGVAVIISLILSSISAVTGSLSSTDLAIGRWNIQLHCDPDFFASELFPLRYRTISQHDVVTSGSKRHECSLCLFSNGTFLLAPSRTSGDDEKLQIRGDWVLHRNPYCVTDRYYDALVLTSRNRIQKRIDTTTGSPTTEVLQKLRFQINCRLYGHFSGGGLWHWLRGSKPPYPGRLSHGTVLKGNDSFQTTSSRRLVVGSFSGRRRAPLDSDDDEI